MNFRQAFGKQLKIYRKAKNISQEEFAELIGVHARQISKIETGAHFPTAKTLENICMHLQITPRDLFDFSFEPSVENTYLMTGTGVTYNYKATVKNNIIYLHDVQNERAQTQKIPTEHIEEGMFDVAKNLKRSVLVKYLYPDGTTKTIEYFPNRQYKVLVDTDKEIQDLADNIKELLKNPNYLEFIKLTADILKKGEGIDKMENILAGMKIAGKR